MVLDIMDVIHESNSHMDSSIVDGKSMEKTLHESKSQDRKRLVGFATKTEEKFRE